MAAVAAETTPSTSAGNRPPNLVLIVADDLGYGELGCYGQRWINTPHIDALASQGMRFTQFYAGSAVCAPSRCVLMTGKHGGHAHVRDNGDPQHLQHLKEKFGWEFPGQHPLPPEEVTVAELLQTRGYAAGAMGKWGLGHFGTTGDPLVQGFDLFYGFNCQRHAHNHYPKFLWRNRAKEPLPGNDRTLTGETYSQDKFTEVALEFIRGHAEQPFFLYLPFAIPHLSIQAPAESLAEYVEKIPEADYQHRGYLKHPTPRAGYAAMVSHMDRDVGKITALIDELGLGPQTLILFTSDNGPTYDRLGGSDSNFFNSAAGMRGLKGSLYEGGIRVPLIARWTGHVPAGQTSDHVSAFYDFLPTFCELAGAHPPSDIDGISMAPALRGAAQPSHDYLFWEFAGYGGQQAVRQGDWKALRTQIRKGNQQLEIYNLKDDAAESRDLAKDRPELVERFKRILRDGRTESELFPL